MKFEVIINKNYKKEIDDLVFFDKQPRKFQNLYNELQVGGIADFDNCSVLVIHETGGRVIITPKMIEDEE